MGIKMWDDIIIGSGTRHNTAYREYSSKSGMHISSNASAYWISDAYLGLGLTVYKTTDVGRALEKLLHTVNATTSRKVEKLVEDAVITYATRKQLKQAIARAVADGFENGRRHQQDVVRAALGM